MKRLASAFPLALVALATSCTGGSQRAAFVPATQPAVRSVAPDALSVGGIVNTAKWSVAAQKTVKVTKNLAVFASTSVSIAGTLVVPRGISVAFFTPSFSLTGSINTSTNKAWRGPVDDFVSACQIAQNGSWEIGAGDNVGITSSRKQNADPKSPCTVVLSRSFFLDGAAKGGSDKNRPNGQDGGSIVIGTTDAIARMQQLAKQDGHKTWRAYAPDVVEIDNGLNSASGGDGKDDKKGTFSGDTYTYTGTNAGIGGAIEITTGKITGSSPVLTAGNGGSGGTVASLTTTTSKGGNPLNGTPAHPDGYDIRIAQGAGGGGGSIFIKANSWPKNSVWQPGNGGNPSLFYGLGIGSGSYTSCENCILGGSGLRGLQAAPGNGTSNGGSVELDLASVGKKGVGDRNDKPGASNGKYSAMLMQGSYGGAWSQGAFNTGVAGGNGGDLIIVPPKHIAISSLKQFGLAINIYKFGNGVTGTYWCPDTPPATGSGFNGGNGGHLYDNGLMEFITITPYGSTSKAPSSSFNGGNGSGGNPPGTGGTGGTNDEGEKVGDDGQNGNAC